MLIRKEKIEKSSGKNLKEKGILDDLIDELETEEAEE